MVTTPPGVLPWQNSHHYLLPFLFCFLVHCFCFFSSPIFESTRHHARFLPLHPTPLCGTFPPSLTVGPTMAGQRGRPTSRPHVINQSGNRRGRSRTTHVTTPQPLRRRVDRPSSVRAPSRVPAGHHQHSHDRRRSSSARSSHPLSPRPARPATRTTNQVVTPVTMRLGRSIRDEARVATRNEGVRTGEYYVPRFTSSPARTDSTPDDVEDVEPPALPPAEVQALVGNSQGETPLESVDPVQRHCYCDIACEDCTDEQSCGVDHDGFFCSGSCGRYFHAKCTGWFPGRSGPSCSPCWSS